MFFLLFIHLLVGTGTVLSDEKRKWFYSKKKRWKNRKIFTVVSNEKSGTDCQNYYKQ